MTELLVIAGLVAAGIAWLSARRRAALNRARARAEGMLNELADAACDAIARGDEDTRRGARAVDRYARNCDRVAAARTARELDSIVARHELRQSANELVRGGIERVRSIVPLVR